jgi:hypothetical protein
MVVGVVAKGAGLPEGHPRVHQIDDHLVAVRRRAVQLQLAVAQQVQGLGLVAVPEQDLAGIVSTITDFDGDLACGDRV